ncbi:MAG TPA: hypothetical protein DC049_05525, partial [Spirochaetia bacterium]|nr:hypothetical protein [Spirochaetia bacterium]
MKKLLQTLLLIIFRDIKAAYIVAVVFMSLPAGGYSVNYYVATSGNNTNAGTIGSPWRTIAYAAGRVRKGDVVTVGEGTYYGQVNLYGSNSGTASEPVVFTAANGAHVILEGSGTSDHGFFISLASYITVRGFE